MKALAVSFTLIASMTIAWASAPFVLIQSTAAAAPAGAKFIGNSQCKVCHNAKADGEQWNIWKTTSHAKAFENLKTDEAKQKAIAAGVDEDPSEVAACVQCHVTGYDVEMMSPPAKIKIADGVQCESCHGPASMHAADGKKIKFSPDTAGDIDVAANLATISEETCTKCHNEKSASWDPERYTKADGSKAGFDFEQAKVIIAHPNPNKADK